MESGSRTEHALDVALVQERNMSDLDLITERVLYMLEGAGILAALEMLIFWMK